MKRRNLLKGIAASGTLSMGVAGAAGKPNVHRADIEQVDRVFLKDGNRVIDTVENPTWDDVKQLNSDATDDQQVVSSDDTCYEYCRSNCSMYCTCAYACDNCCNVQEEICDCCSQTTDTDCCDGC